MSKSKLIKVYDTNEEYRTYESDLNWRDDGDALSDPSSNDFMLGYKLNPYDQRSWTAGRKQRTRTAVHEVVQIGYTPEALADYILALWDRLDGTLQDLFDGFTVRYNNNLKTAIAEEIKKRGYEVLPQLVDDRAFFASRLEAAFSRFSKSEPRDKLHLCRIALGKSEALRICVGELDDIHELGDEVSQVDAMNVLKYYEQIFPDDFAIALCTDYISGDKGIEIPREHFKDYELSDESLRSIEKMLSGNQDPWYAGHSGGGEFGYDYVSDMRGFDGVRPEQYEVTSCRRVVADVMDNIPLSVIEPVINEGCANVYKMLSYDGYAAPPRHLRTIRRQKNRAESYVDFEPTIDIPNDVDVYEVWEVALNTDDGVECKFIVVSAKCTLAGMSQPTWSEPEYRGFFSAVDEAEKNISEQMI